MTPQIALSKSSYEAIHELLDISLTVDPKLATVFFSHQANCGVIMIDIHLGGWSQGVPPDKTMWISPAGITAERASEELRAYLSPENLAAVAAQKRAARVTALEQQLVDARKEIA